ncbi:MAG: VCBS repeat-containing protein [Candidatus Azobacteroides sp.]|nr:VCBS repeat-containing protein [Candidatus Azobacteroides sp.]
MVRQYLFCKRGIIKRKRLIWLLVFFASVSGSHGQTFQLNTDNVFVQPNGSARWNVLGNDELGTDHWSEVEVEVVTYPHHADPGSVKVEAPLNMIQYVPLAGFSGRDSLEYKVFSSRQNLTATAWVYINVYDQPDNLYTDKCTTPAPAQEWGITSTRTNEINLSPYQIPITGDIDGDGIVEILVSADPQTGTINGIQRYSSKIAIYKGDDITRPPTIINTVSPYSWTGISAYAIAKTKLDGKDSTLIVVAEGDRYLRAYNYTGQLIWTSDVQIHTSEYLFPGIGFADLNRDGIPEILVYGKIFDSVTGKLLCQTPIEIGDRNLGNNTGLPYGVDLFNDGEMYLVVGNYIYKPDDELTTMTFVRKITPEIHALDPDKPSTAVTLDDGGFSLLADIDNDGKLDLVVSIENAPQQYTFLYVADPATGEIKASKYISFAGTRSFPFVGDIDGDGYPEIVCIKNRYNGGYDNAYMDVLAYKYVKGNPVLQEFWKLKHADTSGGTGMTLFDFNQDGISELVYRDEENLRIINGSGVHHETGASVAPYDLASFSSISGTGHEYATIADIDGDGQAEILIVGAHPNISGTTGNIGPLWVYKTEFPETSPWAPARKTWNQYLFNPVYINDDLTVPAYPLHPATEFVTKSGKRHRPFNNFFQQATELNDEGEPLFMAPDIAFVYGYPAHTIYMSATGEVDVSLFVINEGDGATHDPLSVSVYAVKTDGTYDYLHTEEVHVVIEPQEQRRINFTFNYTLHTNHTGFEVRLNEKNGMFFFDECLTSNNYANGKMFSPDERIICEGETELIELYPLNVYRFEWYVYDKSISDYRYVPEDIWQGLEGSYGYRIGHNGETLEITKNGDMKETFYVLLYDLDNNLLSMSFDSVCVYLTPDSLVWTGTESADWHNYGNWLDPNEVDPYNPVNPTSKIPRKCTNVLIPDGLMVYPDLSPSTTTYYDYTKPECRNITFEHGGEVARTDTLDYDAAYIHQQLESNR